jgi:TRAP-type transport system small permease protein
MPDPNIPSPATRPAASPDLLFRLLEWLIAGCLAVMVVMVFGNVVLRYAFNSGIATSEELARLAFVWLVFMGAVVALRERGHIGIDMVVSRLPVGGKRLCFVINHLIVLWLLWLLGEGSWQQTLIGLDSTLPVTGLPVAAFSAAGLVTAAAMAVLTLVDLVRVLTGRLDEAALVQVRESVEIDEAAAEPAGVRPVPVMRK